MQKPTKWQRADMGMAWGGLPPWPFPPSPTHAQLLARPTGHAWLAVGEILGARMRLCYTPWGGEVRKHVCAWGVRGRGFLRHVRRGTRGGRGGQWGARVPRRGEVGKRGAQGGQGAVMGQGRNLRVRGDPKPKTRFPQNPGLVPQTLKPGAKPWVFGKQNQGFRNQSEMLP